LSDGFSPSSEVILNEAAPPLDTAPSPDEIARVEPSGTNRILVRTRASSDAYLVLSEVYYQGWSARIDGQPTSIYRADHAFRAILVPAGEHVVELRFVPPRLVGAAWVSALAWILVGGAFFLVRQRGMAAARS
jgi:uncharacterized membrane protein YfhO